MNKNKSELVIVTVTFSFDDDIVAVAFDSYEKACDYIKKDFERELEIDRDDNEWEIDEEQTYCEENGAVLATVYNGTTETTTWQVARLIDERNDGGKRMKEKDERFTPFTRTELDLL